MPVANVRFTQARKRDGRMVAIDQGRIMNAVRHAMEASAEGNVARDPKLVAGAAMTAFFPLRQSKVHTYFWRN